MIKRLILLLFVTLSVVATNGHADPIQDLISNGYVAGWYPNSFHGAGPLSCAKTCDAWVSNQAEHEFSSAPGTKGTSVCKVGGKGIIANLPFNLRWSYGNQFDSTPLCYTTDQNGQAARSQRFMCLCVNKSHLCPNPDLVVVEILEPQWDHPNSRSVIKARIKNIGNSTAASNLARVVDPSTLQSTGAPYNAVALTPALAPGAEAVVTFYLPYWVYNPDADLEVTADYKNVIDECDEDNNTKTFQQIG